MLRACAAGPAPRPLRLRPQFGKGIGARPGEVVEQWYLDPQQYKGKTPGEAAQGKLVCDKLYELGILPAPSTWLTIGARVEWLVKEATAWETAYGTLDKIPTGGAKTKRVVHNADTGLNEETDWPWEKWMWNMIRLGKLRSGAAGRRGCQEGGRHRRAGEAARRADGGSVASRVAGGAHGEQGGG